MDVYVLLFLFLYFSCSILNSIVCNIAYISNKVSNFVGFFTDIFLSIVNSGLFVCCCCFLLVTFLCMFCSNFFSSVCGLFLGLFCVAAQFSVSFSLSVSLSVRVVSVSYSEYVSFGVDFGFLCLGLSFGWLL